MSDAESRTSDPARTGTGGAAAATAPHGPRFDVRATAESHFSWLRTRLSVERTLMSWVRTATALIGFGFTIVQFFERFSQMEGIRAAVRPGFSRMLGLALMGSGLVALIISVWQYVTVVRYLRGHEFAAIRGERAHTPLVALSLILFLIGLFAFLTVLFRLL